MGSIPESMASDTLNAIRLSEDPLGMERRKMIRLMLSRIRASVRACLCAVAIVQVSSSRRAKMPQGRRRAGSSAPTRTSGTSRLEESAVGIVPSPAGGFDQEAQVGR
jgi:hypothetical protein